MTWSTERPTEPGYYWFYGRLWKVALDGLYLVAVCKDSRRLSGLSFNLPFANDLNVFEFSNEHWMRIPIPEEPKEEEHAK